MKLRIHVVNVVMGIMVIHQRRNAQNAEHFASTALTMQHVLNAMISIHFTMIHVLSRVLMVILQLMEGVCRVRQVIAVNAHRMNLIHVYGVNMVISIKAIAYVNVL